MPQLRFGKKRILLVGKSRVKQKKLFKLAQKQYFGAKKGKVNGIYFIALGKRKRK